MDVERKSTKDWALGTSNGRDQGEEEELKKNLEKVVNEVGKAKRAWHRVKKIK